MSQDQGKSRRDFLKETAKPAAITTLAAGIMPKAFAADSSTINLAVLGCGGRGTGAVVDALSVKNGPIKLIAMSDVFQRRLDTSSRALKALHEPAEEGQRRQPVEFEASQIDVPPERMFAGIDSYKKAIDCLRPGDVAIMASPPAFRWVHFQYAIDRGVNVFMEKPITVDGPTSRRMLQLAEVSEAKKLKVGVGLMCRHCEARKQLLDRINDGAIGEIENLRAYRMHGPVGYFASGPKPKDQSDLLYQIERFHSFLWASGGAYSDFYIHNIDECCWMKGAWPVKAHGIGGRHNRGDAVDQNFDSYTVEYTFADDSTLHLWGRCIDGTYSEFASYAHGTKGSAIISANSHTPARCAIFKGQNVRNEADLVWRVGENEPNPYRLEWVHLIDAIRKDQPYNEVKRGVEASLVTSMGRMAAHTGQTVTYEQILNSDHEFAPGLDQVDEKSPAPLQPDKDGKYPIPQPGVVTDREY